MRQSQTFFTDAERAKLADFACDPSPAPGSLAALSRDLGRSINGIRAIVSVLRSVARQPGATALEHYSAAMKHRYQRLKAQRLQQDGAEGGQVDAGPARVPRVAPSAAAPASEHGVSEGEGASLNSAPAVQDPRTVAPAAGPLPPDPCDRDGGVPAATLSGMTPAAASPGLCWARDLMARGVARDKVLRTAGDRLTWRGRAALAEPAHA